MAFLESTDTSINASNSAGNNGNTNGNTPALGIFHSVKKAFSARYNF